MDIKEEYKTIRGAKIHYLTGGDAKSRDKVILLHGKRYTSQDWRQVGILEKLSMKGFHVIALDLPGYGKSEPLEGEIEDFLLEFSDELKIEEFHLVGPSFSGEIALKFALKYGHRLKSLILVGSINVERYANRLKDINVRTLIIWGEKDDIAPYEFARLLKNNIRGSILYTFHELGHACYLECPERFVDILTEFLSG